jgi:hypothetical protein
MLVPLEQADVENAVRLYEKGIRLANAGDPAAAEGLLIKIKRQVNKRHHPPPLLAAPTSNALDPRRTAAPRASFTPFVLPRWYHTLHPRYVLAASAQGSTVPI